jgi:DNA helicase HerA-like ATPase
MSPSLPSPRPPPRSAWRLAEPSRLHVSAGSRALIVGPTGSGKSNLASFLAWSWERVLVFDPKADPSAVLPNSTVARGSREAWRRLPGRVIYRPDLDDHAGLPDAFDPLVARVWRSGHHGILLHETVDVAPGGNSGARRWLSMTLRQGRSRAIPVLMCTQRPVWIDRLCRSEADHVFLFGLNDDEDVKAVASVMRVPWRALVPPRDVLGVEFGFYHRGPTGRVTLHRPIRLMQ